MCSSQKQNVQYIWPSHDVVTNRDKKKTKQNKKEAGRPRARGWQFIFLRSSSECYTVICL